MMAIFLEKCKKMGEVDFVTELNGNVFPIEVKSGKEYDIQEAIVLCNDNTSEKGKVRYLPIYMIMFVHKEKISNTKFSLDLSGLS